MVTLAGAALAAPAPALEPGELVGAWTTEWANGPDRPLGSGGPLRIRPGALWVGRRGALKRSRARQNLVRKPSAVGAERRCLFPPARLTAKTGRTFSLLPC